MKTLKFILNLIRRIIRKIIKICFGKLFVKYSTSEVLSIDDAHVKEAFRVLNDYYPNVNTSCITKNDVRGMVDLHIIVPAYNVEKYIMECIDSIVLPKKSISYKLTIINDGSTDNTGELLKKYIDIPEVEIITQENKGLSGARNTGLQHIQGKYVFFVDSDDYICWENLERMLLQAEKNDLDIVEGSYFEISDKGKIFHKHRGQNFSGFAWGKLYKSSLFENLCFPEKYWFEDTLVSSIILDEAKTKDIFNEPVYYYRKRFGSITSVASKFKKSLDTLWVFLSLEEDRKKLNLENEGGDYVRTLKHIYLSQKRLENLEDEIKKNVFIIFCKVCYDNYKNCTILTNNKKLISFARIIETYDYGKFKAFVKWINLN